MELRCYSKKNEKINLIFYPCSCKEDITWEEWHQCDDPLVVFKTDYNKLLIPYLQTVFPVTDPIDHSKQKFFDVCWDNWIGKQQWIEIINLIEAVGSTRKEEQEFYKSFLEWIKMQLERWDIIVVEGNQ